MMRTEDSQLSKRLHRLEGAMESNFNRRWGPDSLAAIESMSTSTATPPSPDTPRPERADIEKLNTEQERRKKEEKEAKARERVLAEEKRKLDENHARLQAEKKKREEREARLREKRRRRQEEEERENKRLRAAAKAKLEKANKIKQTGPQSARRVSPLNSNARKSRLASRDTGRRRARPGVSPSLENHAPSSEEPIRMGCARALAFDNKISNVFRVASAQKDDLGFENFDKRVKPFKKRDSNSNALFLQQNKQKDESDSDSDSDSESESDSDTEQRSNQPLRTPKPFSSDEESASNKITQSNPKFRRQSRSLVSSSSDESGDDEKITTKKKPLKARPSIGRAKTARNNVAGASSNRSQRKKKVIPRKKETPSGGSQGLKKVETSSEESQEVKKTASPSRSEITHPTDVDKPDSESDDDTENRASTAEEIDRTDGNEESGAATANLSVRSGSQGFKRPSTGGKSLQTGFKRPTVGMKTTGVKAPASAVGMKGPASAVGMKSPASAVGMKSPASAVGMKSPASAVGMKGPASAVGMKTPASALGMKGPVSAGYTEDPSDSESSESYSSDDEKPIVAKRGNKKASSGKANASKPAKVDKKSPKDSTSGDHMEKRGTVTAKQKEGSLAANTSQNVPAKVIPGTPAPENRLEKDLDQAGQQKLESKASGESRGLEKPIKSDGERSAEKIKSKRKRKSDRTRKPEASTKTDTSSSLRTDASPQGKAQNKSVDHREADLQKTNDLKKAPEKFELIIKNEPQKVKQQQKTQEKITEEKEIQRSKEESSTEILATMDVNTSLMPEKIDGSGSQARDKILKPKPSSDNSKDGKVMAQKIGTTRGRKNSKCKNDEVGLIGDTAAASADFSEIKKATISKESSEGSSSKLPNQPERVGEKPTARVEKPKMSKQSKGSDKKSDYPDEGCKNPKDRPNTAKTAPLEDQKASVQQKHVDALGVQKHGIRKAKKNKRKLDSDVNAGTEKGKKQRTTQETKDEIIGMRRKKAQAQNLVSDPRVNNSSISPALSDTSTPNRTPTNQSTPPGNSLSPSRNTTPKRTNPPAQASQPTHKRARTAHHQKDPRLKEATKLRKLAQSETNKQLALKSLFSGGMKFLAAIGNMRKSTLERPEVIAEWIYYGRRAFFMEIESQGKELDLVWPTIAAMYSRVILSKFMLDAMAKVNKLYPKRLNVDWKRGDTTANQQRMAFSSVLHFMLDDTRINHIVQHEMKMTFNEAKEKYPTSDEDVMRRWEVLVERIVNGREQNIEPWVSACEEIQRKMQNPTNLRKDVLPKIPRKDVPPRSKSKPGFRAKRDSESRSDKKGNDNYCRHRKNERNWNNRGDRTGYFPDRKNRRKNSNGPADRQRPSASMHRKNRSAGTPRVGRNGNNRKQDRGRR